MELAANINRKCLLCKKLSRFVFSVFFLGLFHFSSAMASSLGQAPQIVYPDWWETVQKNIRSSEYQASKRKAASLSSISEAWQAPNRANGFRTYFIPEGIRVIPRDSETSSWTWGMNFTGYSFEGEAVSPKDFVNVSVSGNRIEYHREGVVEWYLNEERGLEQGFTLKTAPQIAQQTAGSWLLLEMKLLGNLKANLTKSGDGIDFLTPAGIRVLNYSKLQAFDATGKHLATQFSLPDDNRLHLLVDTSAATYPITIDPLLTSPAWFQEGSQANAEFGCSVSTAGDVNGDGFSDVIVGAYGYDNDQTDEGRAFVFYGSASGLSTVPSWSAEGNNYAACYGKSVSTAGDVNSDGFSDIIVGAYDYTHGQLYEGAAFVYNGSASGLSIIPDWSVEGNMGGAHFGYSVSTAGDVNGDGFSDIIFGAYGYNNGQSYEGAAFVFHGSASGLPGVPNWSAEGDKEFAEFGNSVSTAGDVNGDGFSDVIVGSHWYDNGQAWVGAAFVFHGSTDKPKAMPWLFMLLSN